MYRVCFIEPREERIERSGRNRRAKAHDLPEVYWHIGPKPKPGLFGINTWKSQRRRERPQPGLPLAIPLVHVLNYLQDRPPWCCFAPDKAQVRCRPCLTKCYPQRLSNALTRCEMGWCWLQEKAAKLLEQQAQRADNLPLQQQQQSQKPSCSQATAAPQHTVAPEQAVGSSSADRSAPEQGTSEERLAGTLPLFRIPGLSLVLPTTAGHVDFAPLFLSKEQLDITWVRGSYLCTHVKVLEDGLQNTQQRQTTRWPLKHIWKPISEVGHGCDSPCWSWKSHEEKRVQGCQR